MNKDEKIEVFLSQLAHENTKTRYPFTVVCTKCGSSNVVIYHGCNYYDYSEYTTGFENSCGLKCKDCGNASEIEIATT